LLSRRIYRLDENRRRGFIASDGYRVMLRLLGALWTGVGLLLVAVLTIPGFAVLQRRLVAGDQNAACEAV